MRFVVFFISALLSVALHAETTLQNPAFEGDYKDGVAPSWKKFPIRGLVRGSFSESAEGHAGGKAQLVECTELMGAWLQLSAPITGGIVEGHDYEARVWLRPDRRMDNTALLVHDSTAWFPKTHATASQNLVHGWQEIVLRFRATKTDEKALLGVKLEQEGKLWVDDASIRELTPEERPPEVSGNLVRDGSFEAGLGSWTSYHMGVKIVGDPAAPHGGKVAELPGGGPGRELQSSALRAPWGRRHTLSLWLRASNEVPVRVMLRDGSTAFAKAEFRVGKSWERFTLPVEMPPLPEGFCHVAISPGAAVVWADGVQLEAGENATAYVAAAPLEASIVFEQMVLTTGETPVGRVVANNTSTEPRKFRGTLRVRDPRRGVVSTVPFAADLTPGVNELPLPPESFAFLSAKKDAAPVAGCFLAELSESPDEAAAPLAERSFALLPPQPARDAALPPIGVQVDYGGGPLAARAGINLTKSWLLNWGSMESPSGEWRFPRDKSVDEWIALGLRPLAVLSEAPRRLQMVPEKNAADWGWYRAIDPAGLREYARRVAEHYAGKIDTFDLQNEPDVHFHPPAGEKAASNYAREALALAQGIHDAQPNARILLGGGVTMSTDPEKWLAGCLAAEPGLREVCNGFSYHNYSADPAVTRRTLERLRATMRELGWEQPIWDTEWNGTHSVASLYRTRPRHLLQRRLTALDTASETVAGFIHRIGEGLAGSAIYQSFGPGGMGSSEFDIFQEADGAPRPALPAVAVMVQRLIGAKTLGPVELPGCWAYRFERADGSAFLVAWAKATEPKPVQIPAPFAARGVNLFGATLGDFAEGAPVTVGFEPIYLERRTSR